MVVTCSECGSVAVVIQREMRLRLIILLSVTCLALPYVFTLLHGVIFGCVCVCVWGGGGGDLSNVRCGFWCSLQLLSGTFLIVRRNVRDKIVNVYRFSCKVPLILVFYNAT
jgi:hypothetical protein